MLHDPEWVIARSQINTRRADLAALAVIVALSSLLLAYLALHSPVTAFSGANRYVFNECPTGAVVAVYDWGDDTYMVREMIDGNTYTIGYYSPRSEALAVASRTCNN